MIYSAETDEKSTSWAVYHTQPEYTMRIALSALLGHGKITFNYQLLGSRNMMGTLTESECSHG